MEKDKELTKENVLTIDGYVWDPPNEEQIKEAGGITELNDMSGWRSGHVLIKKSDLVALGYLPCAFIRSDIMGLALDLEKMLAKHDKEKSDSWRRTPAMELFDGLETEQRELEDALKNLNMNGICDETLDNIAYLMFIYFRIKEVNELDRD